MSVRFLIYLKQYLGSDEWEKTKLEKEHNWFNVTDLEPGPTEIRIVAVNGRGDERRSEPVTVHVGPRGMY